MKKETAYQKVFDMANLLGESVDLYSLLYKYKVFREMSNEELDKVYDDLITQLGF